jgi:hypothetical protein
MSTIVERNHRCHEEGKLLKRYRTISNHNHRVKSSAKIEAETFTTAVNSTIVAVETRGRAQMIIKQKYMRKSETVEHTIRRHFISK